MNLRDVLGDAAADVEDLDLITAPDGDVVWSRGGQPFAVLSADGTRAEFALDPAVGSAAARTPDVQPSSRGAGWVVFRPGVLDDHGADRAGAWFASAHRRLERT